jgi:hypothetical protein
MRELYNGAGGAPVCCAEQVWAILAARAGRAAVAGRIVCAPCDFRTDIGVKIRASRRATGRQGC